MNRYNKNGFVNVPELLNCGCPFVYFIGPRRTGKTYGLIKELDEKKRKYIYMRRNDAALEFCVTAEGNPYADYNADTEQNILPYTEDKMTYFRKSVIDEETKEAHGVEDVSLALSLTSAGKARGVSFRNYDIVLFDEIVPRPIEPCKRLEGKAWLDFYDTINGNRELQGKKPVQVIYCGNSDRLDCPMLACQGVDQILENMMRSGKKEYINRDRGIAVFNFADSPIAEERGKKTALYKSLPENDESGYFAMAVENRFSDLEDAAWCIKNRPLKEYICFYSVRDLGIWRHKSNGTWYVCRHVGGSPEEYTATAEGYKKFRLKHKEMLDAYLSNRVFFADYQSLIKWRNIFRIN